MSPGEWTPVGAPDRSRTSVTPERDPFTVLPFPLIHVHPLFRDSACLLGDVDVR